MSLPTTTTGEVVAIAALSVAEPKAPENVPPGTSRAANQARPRTFGWERLRESEMGIADLVAINTAMVSPTRDHAPTVPGG